jgi:hypothetical protein
MLVPIERQLATSDASPFDDVALEYIHPRALAGSHSPTPLPRAVLVLPPVPG